MKWFRNKEMLQDILKQNKNELKKYKHDKIVALLKDESNLIQDHLVLLDENKKLKMALEILKENPMCIIDVLRFNNYFTYREFYDGVVELSKCDFDLLKEVMNNEI